MKTMLVFLLASIALLGQAPEAEKVINFDQADREHCSVVMFEGRQMLQTAYGGTAVAIGTPVSTPDGEFRVYVLVRQTGAGKAEIKPKQFSALYSDSAHTRLSLHDRATEAAARRMQEARAATEAAASNARVDPRNQPSDLAGGRDRVPASRRRRAGDLNGPSGQRSDSQAALPGTVLSELYLHHSTLHQGSYAAGFVYFKKPRKSKLEIGPGSSLYELDLPINGVVFRFMGAATSDAVQPHRPE